MRYEQISPVPPLTPVTKTLIITSVVVYFVDFVLSHLGVTVAGYPVTEVLGLVPGHILRDGWFWQFFTYMFLHGPPFHLLLNMLILWYFGAETELRLGKARFLFFFFLCGVGAGVINFLVNLAFARTTLGVPIIGASGAIYGLLVAYAYFFSERYFLVLFLFPMKAKYFVLLLAAIELVTGVDSNPGVSNVAHFAHLGGMLMGALYIYITQRPKGGGGGRSRQDREREKLRRQFTLIVNPDSEKEGEPKGPYWN